MSSLKDGTETAHGSPAVLRCSFCGKSANEVRKLIARPTVSICDQCVEVCNDLIAEDQKSSGTPEDSALQNAAGGGHVVECSLCHMPMEVTDGLPVHNRGLVCVGCIGEVQAAIARGHEPGS